MLSVNAEHLKTHRYGPVAELPFGTLTLVFMTIACGVAQTFDSSDRIADLLGFRFISFSQLLEQPLTQVPLTIIQSLTHVFPHGGWWHLIPNTTALFVFGSMAEKRLGAWPLMTLYFVSGIVGVICHAFVPPLPTSPVAGASLAISGLLGAYCALAINDRSRSFVARCTLFTIELPAAVGVGIWTLAREIPLQRDRQTSILYHLLPMMVMWLLVRGSVALRTRVNGAANKTLNRSG